MYFKNLLILIAAIVAICSSTPVPGDIFVNGHNSGFLNNGYDVQGTSGSTVYAASYPNIRTVDYYAVNYPQSTHQLSVSKADGSHLALSN